MEQPDKRGMLVCILNDVRIVTINRMKAAYGTKGGAFTLIVL